MKQIVTIALLLCTQICHAQEWFSTDGKPRRRRPTVGRMAARIIVYLDTSEVPHDVKRAGLIIITDTRKRERAFEEAKDVAAAYRLEAICLRQERLEQVKLKGRQKNVVNINNGSSDQVHQDSWVFWGYDLPKKEEEE